MTKMFFFSKVTILKTFFKKILFTETLTTDYLLHKHYLDTKTLIVPKNQEYLFMVLM